MSRLCACPALLAGTATTVRAQDPYVAPGAPQDRILEVPTDAEGRRLDSAIAPYVAQARETYPDAYGRIWNEIQVVEGYRPRDRYVAAEAEIIDWMISRPNGTEEGNVVGKFLDTWQR